MVVDSVDNNNNSGNQNNNNSDRVYLILQFKTIKVML